MNHVPANARAVGTVDGCAFPACIQHAWAWLGKFMGLNPMLLLHLAYSEEDLKFKAEIPPFPEAPNHKSQESGGQDYF